MDWVKKHQKEIIERIIADANLVQECQIDEILNMIYNKDKLKNYIEGKA
ncbi:hypothetical protein IJG79_00555 [Candidatus Saccharibacteria bacterium]|nr:hypothetical protein [Candidatus Saccharibacteria bacterium]